LPGGAYAAHLGQGGVCQERRGSSLRGLGLGRLSQPQTGWRHHGNGAAATPELEQPFATLAHQSLPLTKPELLVAVVPVQQGLQLLLLTGIERDRRCAELTMDKNSEPFAPALQVGKTAIGLKLQPLVQGQQPGLKSLL